MGLASGGRSERCLVVGGMEGRFGRHGHWHYRTGHQVPFDAIAVQSVRQHNGEQQHGHGQHVQRRTRRRTGPQYARE